jgi:nucleotide-binding universal stress UspA family protein
MKRQERAASAIVFATDFLKPAQRAFAYALTLAKALHVRLVILHVIKGMTDPRFPVPPDRRYLRPLKTAALLELGRLVRLAQEAGIRAEPRLQVGHPATSVIDVLPGVHAQVVVMGTHGRTGWDRLQLGSTAESVIREASCPVVTVRGLVAGDAGRSHRPVRLKRLLVATDFSACAHAALRYAAGLAQRLESELVVLHIFETPRGPGAGRSGAEGEAESSVGQAHSRRQLNQVLSALRAEGVVAEGRCVAGEPIDVILTQAAQWAADAIVIGTHGRRGLRRAVLGSLAEQVVRRAGCPVLTVNRSATHVRL